MSSKARGCKQVEVVIPLRGASKRKGDSDTSGRTPDSTKRRRVSSHATIIASSSRTKIEDLVEPRSHVRSGPTSSASSTAVARSRPQSPGDNEVQEDEIGDILADEDDTDTAPSTGRHDTVPIRRLSNFTIYTAQRKPVDISSLLPFIERDHWKSATKYYARGEVRTENDTDFAPAPQTLQREDVEEDEVDVITLAQVGPITRFDAHNYDEESGRFDGKIYILTHYAWYILDTPAAAYLPLYIGFFLPHRIFHTMLLQALDDPELDWSEFRQHFLYFKEEKDVVSSHLVLDRALTVDDLEDEAVSLYIASNLHIFRHVLELSGHPLIRQYLEQSPAEVAIADMDEFLMEWEQDEDAKGKAKAKGGARRRVSIKKADGATVVTPTVSFHCQPHFRPKLLTHGGSLVEDDDVDHELVDKIKRTVQIHETDPESMEWGPVTRKAGYYASVTIDGEVYKPNDVVMVQPSEGERVLNISKNVLANRGWFAEICFFFDQDGQKMFHARWFEHGSRTIVKEVAPSQAVYRMETCDDLPLETIIQKVNVTFNRDPEVPEPKDLLDKGAVTTSTEFTCSFAWNMDKLQFYDLPSPEDDREALRNVPRHEPCATCGRKEERQVNGILCWVEQGIRLFGINYHERDCVYIKSTPLLEIAQIVKLPHEQDSKPVVTVRYLRRMTTGPLKEGERYIAQERQLYLTNDKGTVDPFLLQGKCYVQYLSHENDKKAWAKADDNFYISHIQNSTGFISIHPSSFNAHCDRLCVHNRKEELRKEATAKETISPLRTLELFAGAGGLGTGLALSGAVEIKWAVEHWKSAAKTYQHNHPHAIVYCQDVNKLLAKAINPESEELKALVDNVSGDVVPDMPKPGEVDFICGGPPCQSFSRANHHPDPDDFRSILVMNFLSFVEFYEPKYFLIENVPGIFTYPLMGILKHHGRSLEGGIDMGIVKLIYLISLSLGYQIHMKVLQAGSYGAPQNRQRVIFVGARRGLLLPEFPLPTHTFPVQQHTLPGCTFGGQQQYVRPPTRSPNPDDPHTAAPLPAVTVDEATDDLPWFEWKRPYKRVTPTTESREGDERRLVQGIEQFDATDKAKVIGFEEVQYRSAPRSAFQTFVRSTMKSEWVTDHLTRGHAAKIIDASCAVPMRAGANHCDLPEALRSSYMKNDRKHGTFYGRLSGSEQFRTAMTLVGPNVKGSYTLHPRMRRAMTVREAARSQGFLDSYVFQSTALNYTRQILDKYKQIGNAVPVPLAFALGKSFAAVLFNHAKEDEREGSVEL